MTLEDAIRERLLAVVPEFVTRVREELGRPRMVLIDDAPIARRRLLDAERARELSLYRIGHSVLVDETELYVWIRRHGARRDAPRDPVQAVDDVGTLIELGDRRRRPRGGSR